MFVIGKLLSHLRQALGAHEECSALAPPGETEVVIRPVLLGILGIFTTTVRLAADVVLLAQTARMDGPQLGELLFQMLDLVCDWGVLHTDIITVISDIVKHFLSKIPNFLDFFPQPRLFPPCRRCHW